MACEMQIPHFAVSIHHLQPWELEMSTILLIVLVLLLLGALPAWPHSRNWGYAPGGGLGLILVIVIILVLMRVI